MDASQNPQRNSVISLVRPESAQHIKLTTKRVQENRRRCDAQNDTAEVAFEARDSWWMGAR